MNEVAKQQQQGASSTTKLFSFRKVDERSWQLFRGSQLLNEAFSNGRFQSVSYISGHLAVLLSSSSNVLICFDTATVSKHLSDDELQQLRSILTSGNAERAQSMQRMLVFSSGNKIIWFGFLTTVPLRFCAVDTSGNLFAWEWNIDDCCWINTGSSLAFFNPVPSNSQITFDIGRNSLVWFDNSSGILLSRQVSFDSKPNPRLPGRRNMFHSIEAITPPNKRTNSGEIELGIRFLPSEFGIWFISSSDRIPVKFFSFKTLSLISANQFSKCLEKGVQSIHSSCVHSLTGELVLITNSCSIISCSLSSDGTSIEPRKLCALEDINVQRPFTFSVSRHSIFIATSTCCKFYDLLSGVHLGDVEFPPSAPSQSLPVFISQTFKDPASVNCLFWPSISSPFLQIVSPNPTSYVEFLISFATQEDRNPSSSTPPPSSSTEPSKKVISPSVGNGFDEDDENTHSTIARDSAALSAVIICSDWGLDQWVAQSAFDLLLKGIPHKNVEQVAKALSSKLQNPSLVVSLLSSRNMSEFIETEISKFLSEFMGSSSSSTSSGSSTGSMESSDMKRVENAKKAYQSFTPLNMKVFPDLLKYLQLLRSQEQGSDLIDSSPSSTPSATSLNLLEIPQQNILSLDWQSLWRFAEDQPKLLCDKLFNAMHMKLSDLKNISSSCSSLNINVHPSLLQEEQHAPGNSTPAREIGAKVAARQSQAIFELVSNLLFSSYPTLLPSFITMVAIASQKQLQQTSSNSSPQQQQQKSSKNEITIQGRRKFYSERAILTIPLSVLEGDTTLFPTETISAAAKLLSMAGRHLPAIILLLRSNLWDDCLVELAEAEETNKGELFSVLLNHSLQSHRVDRLEQLWKLSPYNLTALDIVNAVSSHTLQSDVPLDVTVVDPSKQFPLGTFKKVLLDLVKHQQQLISSTMQLTQ